MRKCPQWICIRKTQSLADKILKSWRRYFPNRINELRECMNSILVYQKVIIRKRKVFHIIKKKVPFVFLVGPNLIYANLLINMPCQISSSSLMPMESGYQSWHHPSRTRRTKSAQLSHSALPIIVKMQFAQTSAVVSSASYDSSTQHAQNMWLL